MDDVFTLVADAEALYEEGLREQGDARCREAIERFADDPDEEVAGQVAWCRIALAHSAYERGGELQKAGRGAEAEAAYREAIAGGYESAWLNLGILLKGAPGREDEEIAALRAALKAEEEGVAPWAAHELGVLLHYRGDAEGARACLEVAAEQGDRDIARRARRNLAFFAAGERDRAEFEKQVRILAAECADEDVDTTGSAPFLTRFSCAVAGSRLMRRLQRHRWEAGRARRARRVWSG